MRINQNISAYNSYRNLSVTNNQMGRSLEKLSSGFRINRAADDAAGLVRSEGLRAEIGGTKVAIRNAQDGVSMVQTAEGALEEVHSILQRMRDLAVSAASSTSDGKAEQAEVDELRKELTAIGQRTTFNGSQVFSTTAQRFQVGQGSDPRGPDRRGAHREHRRDRRERLQSRSRRLVVAQRSSGLARGQRGVHRAGRRLTGRRLPIALS